MSERYPSTFAAIPVWARENNVSVTEARVRFTQYAILQAIAESRTLSAALVFKGGNALDLVWQPNRSTIDLDFSADTIADTPAITAAVLKDRLGEALAAVGRRVGVLFAVHRVEQHPPGVAWN